MRPAFVLLLVAACGHHAGDPGTSSDDASGTDDAAVSDGATTPVDAPADAATVTMADAKTPDAFVFPSTLDLKINCRNDCVLVANPSSIAVPAGTEFTVNWINTGDTDCDVAKIDQFNQVPIIIGLEPGTSYHDTVREWCGQFTGTFNFRVSICTIPSYIPVNCNAH
jgi:hypothetical protein